MIYCFVLCLVVSLINLELSVLIDISTMAQLKSADVWDHCMVRCNVVWRARPQPLITTRGCGRERERSSNYCQFHTSA